MYNFHCKLQESRKFSTTNERCTVLVPLSVTHLVPKTEDALASSLAGVLPEEEAMEDVFSRLGRVGVAFVGRLCS